MICDEWDAKRGLGGGVGKNRITMYFIVLKKDIVVCAFNECNAGGQEQESAIKVGSLN